MDFVSYVFVVIHRRNLLIFILRPSIVGYGRFFELERISVIPYGPFYWWHISIFCHCKSLNPRCWNSYNDLKRLVVNYVRVQIVTLFVIDKLDDYNLKKSANTKLEDVQLHFRRSFSIMCSYRFFSYSKKGQS